jgi:2-oxo-3-hexenedioate decarboxylase
MVPPDGLDLALVGLLLEVDGSTVATAAGAATMGHPADAVAMLANWLGTRGEAILPGWVVFSGGLTAAVALTAGTTITATFGHLGSVSVRGI